VSRFNDKLYARVGCKGEIAFVRFNDTIKFGPGIEFEVIWSCGGDRLPTGSTGFLCENDIDELIVEGMLYAIVT